MKPFFIKIPKLWAWADKFWGILGVLCRFISTHFSTVSSLSMFSINQPLFLSLYIQIPNIFWGLGFEFGPQRIWDLAIVCPRFVTKGNAVKLCLSLSSFQVKNHLNLFEFLFH
jgi:hypothetical protein